MSVLEKKQERTKAKTAIKLAARRLISAANREAEFDSLKSLMTELEKSYDDFLVVNEEFESLVTMEGNNEHSTVNGEDVVTYRENVKKSYMEAQEVFLKRRNEDKSNSMAVETVRTALKLEVMTLTDIITSNLRASYDSDRYHERCRGKSLYRDPKYISSTIRHKRIAGVIQFIAWQDI